MRKLVCILAVAGLAACGSDDGSSIEPTKEAIFQDVFKGSCATSGCHDASGQGDLKLTGAGQLAEMVDKDAFATKAAEEGLKLVVAGKPEESYLIDRLENNVYGTRMPQGQEPLPAEVIDSIKQWITDGAK